MLLPRLQPIVGAAWLAIALVILSLVASLAAFREPDRRMAVQSMQCQQLTPDGVVLTAEKTVHPPFVETGADRFAHDVTDCRFSLNLTADEIRDAAILVTAFDDAITVHVNGQRVIFSQVYQWRNLRYSTLPVFVPLSGGVLHEGQNRFSVTLSALPGSVVSLDRIFIGDKRELRPFFHARWFVSAVLPTLGVGGQMALAIVFALLWAVRRHQREYGWLAAALALAAARGSVLMPDFGLGRSDLPIWNMLVVWEVTALLMFCRAIAATPVTRRTWLLAVPPAVLMLVYALVSLPTIASLLLPACIAMIFAYMAMAFWALIRAAMRGNNDALLVLLGLLLISAFMIRDFLSILSQEPTRAFLARAVYSGFLIALAALATTRFLRAMRELDSTAGTLQDRVAAAEAELRDTYEELRKRREAEAVERERSRLMRDLHDGLGGDLASMLALADAPEPRTKEIVSHARAALADMRLIISSLEDFGGDLALALGAWRERTEPQLRAAGIKLVWGMRDLPPIIGLGPAHVLDVLRILQEAVTNVIKHADATQITLEMLEQGDAIGVAIRDNGRAFDPKPGGNGMRNMRMRAQRLNAFLSIGREGNETRVLLLLPRVFVTQI
ncbi:sensor histidine kinase [Croceicoccus estronivorus]|uniref:sensor histidine kinase n=1 Tax=Croceicoccus estronivorus TaxID=1172626 RepID=UPI0038B2EDA7